MIQPQHSDRLARHVLCTEITGMNAAAIDTSEPIAATYLPLRVAQMLKCEYCASHNVRWFTPRSYANRAAVLLCMACRRLTIVPPHARRAERREDVQRAA
jgi:hypothetical protein